MLFERVEVAAEATSTSGDKYSVCIARQPKARFDEVWEQLRVYR
ncbi:MAG: hypothetical protein AAF628_37690 [Planctomycetota bacterium]